MASSDLAARVDARRVLTHLTSLEGERHPLTSPQRLEEAQRYVHDTWARAGLRVIVDEFSYSGERFVNLLARPAACPPGPRLVIGAHVDTVTGTPGADDNASGVAVLLEAAQLVAESGRALAVEFAAFTLEEEGMIGSSHYVRELTRRREALLGMLSLEMVGFTESVGLQHYPWFLRGRFPALGNYLGLVANFRSRGLLNATAGACRQVAGLPVEAIAIPGRGNVVPESRLSDHAPFWDAGYPALLVTDTAFFRNPHYHQPTDTVETLDVPFLTKVTQGMLATIEQLAA